MTYRKSYLVVIFPNLHVKLIKSVITSSLSQLEHYAKVEKVQIMTKIITLITSRKSYLLIIRPSSHEKSTKTITLNVYTLMCMCNQHYDGREVTYTQHNVESALCMVNLQHNMFYLQHDIMFEGVLCMANLQHNISYPQHNICLKVCCAY